MRKSAVVLAVLGLFVGSLLLASVADARVGGGGSSGSRGSRSYSAPRPSTPSPGSPSGPTSPQRSLTPQPGPQRPGGFFGGLGGMIGGFLLGGLIGSLLFGGLGHGFGIGLMDVVLIAGLAYLAFALIRRRAPQPALASATADAGGGGSSPWAPTAREVETRPAGAALFGEHLAAGIAAIRTMDAGFDVERFTAVARDAFVRVQSAWSGRDLSPVRADLTDEMARIFEGDLARLKTLRRVNRLEKLAVETAEVTEAWQEYGQDFVTVRLRASALDYTLDETTGAIIDGSSAAPTAFEEYWTFTRPVGSNPWRLSAIQQPTT